MKVIPGFIRYAHNQKMGKPGITFIRYAHNQKIGKPGITFIRYTKVIPGFPICLL
jgi:hypothetical protein